MPIADYAHWNEDAEYMWWHEEGKHEHEYEPPDPQDDWDIDDGYECLDAPQECIEAGNFHQRRDGDAWECSTCGHGPFMPTKAGPFVYVGEES